MRRLVVGVLVDRVVHLNVVDYFCGFVECEVLVLVYPRSHQSSKSSVALDNLAMILICLLAGLVDILLTQFGSSNEIAQLASK